jgi:hypothetical protein
MAIPTIPRSVGLGIATAQQSRDRKDCDIAASVNNKAPATRAARLSASPCAALARNLHSTTADRAKLDSAVSTEGKQSGTSCPPSCEEIKIAFWS